MEQQTPPRSTEPGLVVTGATKIYPGTTALDGVDLEIRPGEVVALLGENGAGKSTLSSIIAGVTAPTSGSMTWRGEPYSPSSPAEAIAVGIGLIHQETRLLGDLTVAENVVIGRWPGKAGFVNARAMREQAEVHLRRLGFQGRMDQLVRELSVAGAQQVEIAKALMLNARLLILDEPTASLNETDSAALLELLKEFRRNGITSIMISHKLNEISEVADRITVLRDGRTVGTLDCHEGPVDEDEIVRRMVDRDLESRYPKREPKIGEVIFEVDDWSVHHPQHSHRKVVKNVSMKVRAGEVVGISGLMGSGRTEFAMSVFGRAYGRDISGTVKIHGKPADTSDVHRAIKAGLAYVTEDRKHLGLILSEDIRKNVSLAHLGGVSSRGVIDDIREMKVAQEFRDRMRIRSHNVYQETGKLSGGNQQKVVLSKWLFTNPDILILDEPTRGIDVGAKYEIYSIINELADAGKAVIVISSEMPELIGICDRIMVMHEGEFVGEVAGEEATQENIMRAIMRRKGR